MNATFKLESRHLSEAGLSNDVGGDVNALSQYLTEEYGDVHGGAVELQVRHFAACGTCDAGEMVAGYGMLYNRQSLGVHGSREFYMTRIY